MTQRTRRLEYVTVVTALATIAVGLLLALLWFDASDVSLAQEGPAHTVVPGDIRPQAAGAVSGTIIVQKETDPAGGAGFEFTQDIDGTGVFGLGDGDAKTFTDVVSGTYTVGEVDPLGTPGGYALTDLVCVEDGIGNSTTDPVSREASIVLEAGETVTCTFTNTRQTGQITFIKEVTGGDALPSDWTFAVDGPETVGDIASGDTVPLSTGTYTVTEAGPITYTLTGASGVCSLVGDAVILSVTGGGGTCTITNTRNAGQLEVVKALEPPTDPGLFSLWIDGSIEASEISDGGTTGKKTVTTGEHTVRETAGFQTFLGNYDTSISCVDAGGVEVAASDDAGPLPVTVEQDDDIVCTITNTRKMGELTVVKDVEPDDPSTNWEIEVVGATSFTRVLNGDDTTGPQSVIAGNYDITETGGSGTSLADYNTTFACTNGFSGSDTSIAMAVQGGAVITCTFTNTRKTGQLEVVKALEPPTDPGLFNLQIDDTDIVTNVSDGGTTGRRSVPTGVRIVGETAGADTDLGVYDIAIFCVDQGGLGTVVASATGESLAVPVDEDDYIVCTIANTAEADLTIAKTGDASIVDVGDVLNYTVLVTNNGPAPAQAVVVTDLLPDGVTYHDDTDACTEDSPGVLTCRLGTLGATESTSFGVSVIVGPGADNQITNAVTVTSATHDPIPGNNEATEDTLVEFNPAIDLVKGGPISATVSSPVNYIFEVGNDNVAGDGSPIADLTLNDDLTGAPTLIAGDDGDGILEDGETWTFLATYIVRPDDAGEALVNQATAHGTDLDGDPVAATDTHTIAIDFHPGIEVQKTAPPTSTVGAVVTYTVTITNISTPQNAPALVLKELEDDRAGDLFNKAKDGGCSYLAYGHTCTFSYAYTVQDGDPDPLVNSVLVYYEPVGMTLPVTDVASHTLNLFHPSLQVAKAGPEQSEFGDTVTYTVTIANDSSSDTPLLSLVSITDTLKGDLTSADNVASSTCTDELDTGDQCQITYTYTVQTGDPTPLVNTVLVEGQPVGFTGLVTASARHSMGLGSSVYLPSMRSNYPLPWMKGVGLPSVPVRTLTVCPSNPDIVYAGFGTGTIGGERLGVRKSTDAGGDWGATDLQNAEVFGIAVAPGCNTVYAGAWTAGVMRSVDGGDNWLYLSDGLDGAWVYTVVIDPLDSAVLYAGTPDRGVYRREAGRDWSPWGLEKRYVLDLTFAPGGQALYAATLGDGVYRRLRVGSAWTDWQPVNNGIPSAHRDIYAVSVDPQSSSTVFAASRSGGIYRTLNSAGRWSLVLPEQAYHVLVDPGDSDVVYAATANGVYRSPLGGDPGSWRRWNTNLGNLVARALAIGPDSAEYIHVGTEDGAWRRPR